MPEPPAPPHDPWSFSELFPLILGGLALVGCLLLIFLPRSSAKHDDEDSSPKQLNRDDPSLENEFRVSSIRLCDVHKILSDTDPESSWLSPSGALYKDQSSALRMGAEQIADLDHAVDATVRTEGKQVDEGRKTLNEILTELQAAVPIAENLYFSGPAGPCLSYNFQISVTNSAVSSATNTTEDMHQKSRGHAETLTALAQQYDQTLAYLRRGDPALTPGRS